MPEIYPIGGGKGGVGKSFIAASLGAMIAKRGHKVLVIDLDLGASNLHTFLGIKNPQNGINTFLNQSGKSLDSVAVTTNISNLFFISSSHCSIEIANLFHAQKLKLINAIKKLSYDYILLDLGAGTNFNTLDFFLTSDEGVFVCTPEPTSIENAFRFIKAAYLRKLRQIIKRNAFNAMVQNAVSDQNNDQLKSQDIIDFVLKYDPEMEVFLKERIAQFRFKFIINQYRKNADPLLGKKINTICNRHFYSRFQYLGKIRYDDRILGPGFSNRLYIQRFPDALTAADLNKVAEALLQNSSGTPKQ